MYIKFKLHVTCHLYLLTSFSCFPPLISLTVTLFLLFEVSFAFVLVLLPSVWPHSVGHGVLPPGYPALLLCLFKHFVDCFQRSYINIIIKENMLAVTLLLMFP